jgi:hypothetical protein
MLIGYSYLRPAPRLAYVETGRLMVGFKDAAQIENGTLLNKINNISITIPRMLRNWQEVISIYRKKATNKWQKLQD